MKFKTIKIPVAAAMILWALVAATSGLAQGPNDSSRFILSVRQRLAAMKVRDDKGVETPGLKFEDVCKIDSDYISKTVFSAYGAAFLVSEGARTPGSCFYENDADVQRYQKSTKYTSTVIDGTVIELQEPAMTALLNAINEAKAENRSISPLDGPSAARRSYADTVRIWNSRFYPALAYWVGKGKIKPEEAEVAKGMDIKTQVVTVLEWEKKGMYFSTDMSKSILYATAPPGTSQHISMLAFDVVNYGDKRVREILAENGWFQTIVTDRPHFTYLGRREDDLPGLGLKKVRKSGFTFWVPDI
jgi:hypothetical protein